MMRAPKKKGRPLPVLLFWGLVWQAIAMAVGNPLLLPGPVRVVGRLAELMGTVEFWQITATSIGRILLGVVCAVALGTVLGAAAGCSEGIHALLSPVMTTMQAAPVASFAVLVLIWVERDYVPVLICGMMVLPVVYNSMVSGIRTTDRNLLEMAKVYRLKPLTVLKRIWIPSVLPFFRSACCNSLGLGWKAGIAAEVLTVPLRSIGRQISDSKLYLMTEDLFAWTLMVVFLSLVLQELMLRLLEGRKDHA